MNNRFILMKNAEVNKEDNLIDKNTRLSEKGRISAKKIALSNKFDDIDIIVCSSYKSTYETAYDLAKKLGKNIIELKEFNELYRNGEIYLSNSDYQHLQKKSLTDLDYSKYGWETTRNGLERILKAIYIINKNYHDKKIMVFSHGMLLSIYFSFMTDNIQYTYERRERINYCNRGEIKGDKVIKDIV